MLFLNSAGSGTSRARQWGGLKYQVEFWVVATVASSRGATEHNVE